ncbi:splicing factor 3B subunit 6-like protein [Magnolia sinica]|uniref:splicing factor 3B subunit 6-like protein n=1 Tax=Magnolia sinica TaxID=86752 RepID=UPI00265999B0|nr:splicing factor 3B subunit 6-like protein [Magnolia sinica]
MSEDFCRSTGLSTESASEGLTVSTPLGKTTGKQRDIAPSRRAIPRYFDRINPQLRGRLPRRFNTLRKSEALYPKNDFSIFVGNIPFNCSNEDLWGIFDRYGRILEVYIPTLPSTKKPRVFAFVLFHYEQDAKAAMAVLNDWRIHGRVVSVRWAKVRASTSSKTNQGPLTSKVNLGQPDKQVLTKPSGPSYVTTVSAEFHRRPFKELSEDDITSVANPRVVAHKL